MAYSSIIKPSDYFNTKLWNGNSSTQAITGVGFKPDWVWGKQRSGTENHQLLDILRGPNNILSSNTDTGNAADSQILNSFDSNGFTLGNQDQLNDTGKTYVGWNWKANGSGSANTAGSINTAYTSANTTSGFSISKFTGTGSNATVGHGLGVAPKMIILKSFGSSNWSVYHESLGGTKAIFLDLTGAVATHIDYWNNTNPTSTVFSIGTSGNMNPNNTSMIAYCFAEKTGFSKFGSFTGTGSATATPFIYTGFKPAFVMQKVTNAADSWNMYDNRRNGFNGTGARLRAEANSAEDTGSAYQTCDFYSNGYSPQGSDSTSNGSGKSYIYMAFAEAPLVGSNNVPANAR